MHYLFGIRGDMHDVERIKEALNSKVFFMPVTLPDGKIVQQPINGRVEPIQLISYVFPEGDKDIVLNSLGASKENQERWYQRTLKQKAMFLGLRKCLQCEPIPEFTTDKLLFLPQEAMSKVSIMPIGVKKDILDWKDPNGSVHEAI